MKHWAPWVTSSYDGQPDDVRRLAIALGSVRSAIRIIDDSNPPMTVDWAQVHEDDDGDPVSISATDMDAGHIIVNPKPVLDGHSNALGVTTGYALHEGSHAKHSRTPWSEMVITDAHGARRVTFDNSRLALYLWNLIEDQRIEDMTSAEWPGFAPYFDEALEYIWAEGGAATLRKHKPTYSDDLLDKVRFVLAVCRFDRFAWPEMANYMVDADIRERMEDERVWWQAWRDEYLSGETPIRTAIKAALERLAETPEARKQMEQQAADEKKAREDGEELRKQLERLLKEGITGVPQPCGVAGHDHKVLSPEVAKAVEKLVEEGLIEVRPMFGNDYSDPPIRIRRPTETSESRRAYVGRPDSLVEAIRTSLVFRSSAPRYDIKLQKSGELDDEELYRAGMGDYRVFSQRVVEGRPDVVLGLLVDMSGSMESSHKIQDAQRLAQVFVWALHDQPGVSLRVWGHTGDIGDTESEILRLWEHGDPLSRLGLIATIEHGDNYDGHAIAYCLSELTQAPEPQKALIVLSDGLPQGMNYSGPMAMRHVRQVTDWGRRIDIPTIQIAIDPYLRPEDQTTMFGAGWVPFKDASRLPRDLAKVLGRYA